MNLDEKRKFLERFKLKNFFSYLQCVTSCGDTFLKKLGKGLHISDATSNFIIKALFEPRIGSKVFDGSLRKVGVVFDVFGPIFSPYVSIKPSIKDHDKLVNHILFLRQEKRGKKI